MYNGMYYNCIKDTWRGRLMKVNVMLVVCYIIKWGLGNKIEVEVVHLKPNVKHY
jgi:hypothetical protein